MSQAADVIARLDLAPHPEGGWYRETWRADAAPGARAPGTSILFLLDAGQTSHWHRIDASELWLFHAGSALTLRIDDGADATAVRLGSDINAGDVQQALVPPHAWQSATAGDGWALVGCVVVPGFAFAGFELAPAGWSPR